MAGAFQGLSGDVNVVEIAIKKLLGCFVSQNLPRQSVDTIVKEADFISGVVGNTHTLGYKSSQHTVMTLVGAFLAGRIGMSQVHP